ncbi:L,D-transpeptidase [bacterium]|nr:L,D-transpeptidase [bacterium]
MHLKNDSLDKIVLLLISTKETSLGCIRMKNEDIVELKEKVKIGTPVRIEL